MSGISDVWPLSWGTGLRPGKDGRVPWGHRAHQPLQTNESEQNLERREADEQDAALALQFRNGQRDAFDALVQRYQARIFTHLFRLLRNREEAEDLTQETFIRAYRHIGKYDPKRPFRNWLYTIATHVGLNALRVHQRRHRIASEQPERMESAAIGQSAPPPQPISERSAEVAEALNQLPPQSAVLIHLHYHEGMRIREAADVVGMTENAAKVALCRARKMLRQLLTESDNT